MNENEFGKYLQECFGHIFEIREQFSVGGYYIDFYIVEPRIAIEFDESYHNGSPQQRKDRERQKFLERATGCVFLRYSDSSPINDFIIELFQRAKHYFAECSKRFLDYDYHNLCFRGSGVDIKECMNVLECMIKEQPFHYNPRCYCVTQYEQEVADMKRLESEEWSAVKDNKKEKVSDNEQE